jgi:hypothetical protein
LGKWLPRYNSIDDVFHDATPELKNLFPELRRRRDALIHLHNVETALKITAQILAGLPGTVGFDGMMKSGLLFVDGESDTMLARIAVDKNGQLDQSENFARNLAGKNPSHRFKIVYGGYYTPKLSVGSDGIDAPIQIDVNPSKTFPDLSKSSGVVALVDLATAVILD